MYEIQKFAINGGNQEVSNLIKKVFRADHVIVNVRFSARKGAWRFAFVG